MRFAETANGSRQKRERGKVKNPWLTLGLMGAAGFLRKSAARFTQTQFAIAYLKGLDLVRDVIFYQIAVMFCVLFFTFGFFLMQAAVLFVLNVSDEARLKLLFAAGLLNFVIALGALLFLTSSKVWIGVASKHNGLLKELMEENKKNIF